MAYNKCECCYETNDLSSCNQRECVSFKTKEVNRAEETLKQDIQLATEKCFKRINDVR